MSIRYLFFALVFLLPEASIAQTASSTEDDEPVMTSLEEAVWALEIMRAALLVKAIYFRFPLHMRKNPFKPDIAPKKSFVMQIYP